MRFRSTMLKSWPKGRLVAVGALLILVGFASFAAVQLDSNLNLRAGKNEYNITAWEVRNLPSKWLYEIGELFRRDRSLAQKDAEIVRFLELTREIDGLEALAPLSSSDELKLGGLRQQRDRLENRVEASIEARISAVLKEEGLTRRVLGLTDVLWPPLDFEFTDSPKTLAISPRDQMALQDTKLLREDLSLAEVEAIEAALLQEDDLSALAFPTGGIGAYPTIVDYTSSYRLAVEIAAHEWTHNYLFFRPLGFNYYDSNDLRTMNETVADLVAREVSSTVIERWPIELGPQETPPASELGPQIDVGAELRALRGEVDELLQAGEIERAETLMEERRQVLTEGGFQIRKINQAYFAFTNLYAGEAGNPAAVNPIGPKIDELRALSDSLGHFVAIAGEFTSVEDLDHALADLAP